MGMCQQMQQWQKKLVVGLFRQRRVFNAMCGFLRKTHNMLFLRHCLGNMIIGTIPAFSLGK